MYDKLKISARQHTGRLRPHEHTSYIPLAFLILVAGVVLAQFTYFAFVEASPGPQAGSVGLTGTMPAGPPKVAATITTPTDGQHFKTTPITVAGTCPTNTLVEIFKNKIFAGSVNCDSGGKYSIQVDLLYGPNALTAIVYDVLNQAGPVSNTVNVFYDAQAPQFAISGNLNLSGNQLVLITDAVYRGTFPDQMMNVPIRVLGGTPPYAVNVQWGDSKNIVIPHGDSTIFNASHVYVKAGVYEITLQGSDSKGLTAFLQVAAIINGQPGAAVSSTNNKSSLNLLLILLPLFAIAVTAGVSFWLGERREKKILGRANSPPILPLGTTPPTHP